ncbi:hypothetical protein ACK8P5_25655 (plasmid) [Paenibacillus sp. EC2-1]|uniref:hypothetical protein n=1 Tax=Paenibacillus sp. EC2-1 TaxID=3388665 RepID=UPI003BEF18A6
MAYNKESSIADYVLNYDKIFREIRSIALQEDTKIKITEIHNIAVNVSTVLTHETTQARVRPAKLLPEIKDEVISYIRGFERGETSGIPNIMSYWVQDMNFSVKPDGGVRNYAEKAAERIASLPNGLQQALFERSSIPKQILSADVAKVALSRREAEEASLAAKIALEDSENKSVKMGTAGLGGSSRASAPALPVSLDPDYAEHQFMHVEDVLYRYNTGDLNVTEVDGKLVQKSKEIKSTPLYDSELDFITKYADYLGVNSDTTDPDVIREQVLSRLKDDEKTKYRLDTDRRELRTIRSALQEADQGKASLTEALTARQGESIIARRAIEGAAAAGKTNDEFLLFQVMAEIRRGGNEADKKRALKLSVGRLPWTSQNAKDVSDQVSHVLDRMDDKADFVYAEARTASKFVQDYHSFISSMYGDQRYFDQEFQGYIGRAKESTMGSMSEEEYENLRKQTARLSQMREANDQHIKEHYRLMDDKKVRPLSPINKIRGAVAESINEIDDEASKKATDSMPKNLKDMVALRERINADIDSEYTAEIEAYQQRYDAAVARKTDESIDQSIRDRIAPDTIAKPAPLSKDRRRQILEQRIKEDPGNEARFTLDTIEALEESWKSRSAKDLDLKESNKQYAVEIIKPRESTGRYDDLWRQVGRDERIYVPGDQVGHNKVASSQGMVTLQAEHALIRDVQLGMDIPDPKEMIAAVDEYRYKSSLSKADLKAKTDSVLQENFIEVIYEQRWLSQDLRTKNEELYSFLKLVENHTKSTAKSIAVDVDTVSVNVSPRNLVEQLYGFMKQVDDYGTKERTARMPAFLDDMIRTQANWMLQPGRSGDIASTAMDALTTTIDEYGRGQKTIDLTDQGLLRMWSLQGKSPGEIAEIAAKLPDKTITERLQDHVFLDVMGNIHKKWFEDSKAEGSNAVNNLIYEIQDMLVGSGKTGSATEVKDAAVRARRTMENFPYYAQILRMNDREIDATLIERGQKLLGSPSIHDGSEFEMSKRENDGIALIDDEVDSLYEESIKKEQRVYADSEGETRIFDPERQILSGSQSANEEILERNQDVIRERMSGFQAAGKGDLQLALDYAATQGKDSISANIPYEGKVYPGTIRKGSRGEYIADIPQIDRKVLLVDSTQEAITHHQMDNIKPLRMNGGRKMPDVVDPGPLQSNFPYVYDEIQTLFGGNKTPSSPSDTLALMDDFRRGNKEITYMDMETTGVDNSKLPKRVLQPLEVYAQKAQWDPDADDYIRTRKGEIGVIRDGKPTVDSRHIFLDPTEDMDRYLENLVSDDGQGYANRLKATVTESEYKDLRKLKRFKKSTPVISTGRGKNREYSIDAASFANLDRNSRQAILDVVSPKTAAKLENQNARFWYLRNMAKFAKNDNYGYHSGDIPFMGPAEEYMDALREDAIRGSRNLRLVGATDSIGRARVRFSPNQEKMNRIDMVQSVGGFIGDDPLAGQNVAAADWSKVQRVASENVADAQMNLQRALENTRTKIQAAQSGVFDLFGGLSGSDDEYAYVERKPARKRSSPRPAENAVESTWNNKIRIAYKGDDDYKIRTLSRDEVDTLRQDPEAFEQKIRSGEIKRVAGATEVQRRDRLFDRMTEAEGSNLRVTVGGRDLSEQIVQMKAIEDLLPAAGDIDAGSVMSQYDQLASQLNHLEEITGQDFGLSTIANAKDDVARAKTAAQELPKPRVIEQMFASKMASPEERTHNARAQVERWDTASKVPTKGGALHMADYDTKVGLETLGEEMKAVFSAPEMDGFEARPVQAGDFVSLDRKLQDDMPRGVYQVSGIDDNRTAMTLLDTSGQSFTVAADSASGLQHRFMTHFTPLGTDSQKVETARMQFAEDSARRMIERSYHSADTFDAQSLHADEVSRGVPLNQPIRNLNEVYQNISSDGPQNISEYVAAQNPHIFETNRLGELTKEVPSIQQKDAIQLAGGYYNSAEGQSRRSFLNDLRSMQNVGAVSDDEAKNILRTFNDQIKEEGRRRGYMRSVESKAAVQIPKGHGNHSGSIRSIDMTSQQSASQSIWSMAQSMADVGREDLLRSGVVNVSEEAAKTRALNAHVMPILMQNGLIDPFESTPTVAAAARQMMNRELVDPGVELNPEKKQVLKFQEYDSLGYGGRDEEFINFIQESHEKILSVRKEQMTDLQKLRFDAHQRILEEMMTSEIGYHPNLEIESVLNRFTMGDDWTPELTNIVTRGEGLRSLPPEVLGQIGRSLQGSTTDIGRNTLNQIYGTLFHQATSGGPDLTASQMEAMKQLNWVKDSTSEDFARLTEETADLEQQMRHLQGRERVEMAGDVSRMLGELDMMSKTGMMFNPNVQDWHVGASGQNAAKTFGNVDLQSLKNIVDRTDTRYTDSSAAGIVRDQVEQWYGAGMPGRSVDAPIQPMQLNFEPATIETLQREGHSENQARDLLRQMNEDIKAAGATRRNGREMTPLNVIEQSADLIPEREPGVIRKHLQSATDTVKGTWDNLATSVRDSGMGKAAAWIAGLGLAAYATRQFFTAGDPLKVESRPQGHGGQSLTGFEKGDEAPPNQASTGQQKVYASPQGAKGYTIKARGVDNNNVNYDTVMKKMQEDLGEVNLNLRDEQTSMDRKWLEEVMGTYIDRGHL